MNVAILGGGAAGFFAAIKCAEENPRAHVTIYEKGAHVLTKVRISGGGRCNVTHACFVPKDLVKNYPRGGQALLGPFTKFQPADTIKWFEGRGVALKTEDDGRIFPTTDTSLTIINALKEAAKTAGVTVRTFAAPVAIQSQSPRKFRLEFLLGAVDVCERLLLATGSGELGYEWGKSLGHTLAEPVPSLFTLAVPDARLEGLAGLSVDKAELHLLGTDLYQKGPLLITHWGVSGPAVLKLSAWGARVFHDAGYQTQISINWVGLTKIAVSDGLTRFKKDNPRKLIVTQCPFPLPHRLWERLVLFSGLSEKEGWANLTNANLTKLTNVLTASVFAVRGKSTFKEEFVTCGGISLNEVDFRTMESRICPGLYFAGEILDIDGVTGGFNFQSAWTTGWLAGRAMAQAAS